MKISLAETFERLQNKKTRRKSVKHVKHNILHLKNSKIDKIALSGLFLGFVKHVKQFSGSVIACNRAKCTTALRVTAALRLPSGIVVTRNINENKQRVYVSAGRA